MIAQRLIPIALTLFLLGCASPVTGPQTYRDESMSFDIPARWKVTMHSSPGGCGMAFVEAPGEAILSIQGVPTKDDKGLETFAKNFSKEAGGHIPFGKMSSLGFQKFSDPHFGSGLKESVSIALFDVTVPHTRYYRRSSGGSCVFYLVTQVADEDASSVQAGFDEILRTFRPAHKTKAP
jgi:hypothetical protein